MFAITRPAGFTFARLILIGLAFVWFGLTACQSDKQADRQINERELQSAQAEASKNYVISYNGVDKSWHPLLKRLHAADIYGPDVEAWFAAIPPYSSKPSERLLTGAFSRRYLQPAEHEPDGVIPLKVNQESIAKCVKFLHEHRQILERAEAEYGVQKEALVSILMLETTLGTLRGKSPIFWSLACMAETRDASELADFKRAMRLKAEQQLQSGQTLARPVDWTGETGQWLDDYLPKRADWYFTELTDLIRFARKNKQAAPDMLGGLSGELGLCQFMPGNALRLGVDGNGDGVVELLEVEDAIFSVANYLRHFGWRAELDDTAKLAVAAKYNSRRVYGNSLLLMIRLIQDQAAQPDGQSAEQQ